MSRFLCTVADDAEALAQTAAAWALAEARRHRRPFAIALSGGSTPRRFYQLLGQAPVRDAFPWELAHWFWGDERFVPHDHADSNYRMARETLLNHAPIPAANIHPVPYEDLPEQAAAAYQRTLQDFYGADRLDPAKPLFAMNLLGLGTDGHTASLFPGTAALDETKRWATAVIGAKPEPRITLTYPVLNSAHTIAFLVEGAEKRMQLKSLLDGSSRTPAAAINPATGGTLHLFMDRAAAP